MKLKNYNYTYIDYMLSAIDKRNTMIDVMLCGQRYALFVLMADGWYNNKD
jgi:hypothetical protein